MLFIYLFEFIIFVLILIYIYRSNICDYIYDNTDYSNDKINKVCRSLYSYGDNKEYTVMKALVDKDFCKSIIKSGEDYANLKGWSKKRHGFYPTIDNEITKSWKEYDFLNNHVIKNVLKQIEKMYNVDINNIGLNEVFIVKYDMNGQKSLDYHEDGSEFSFILSLNDDYEGGGTKFKWNNETINLDTGDCLIFSGQNTHKGNKITSGTRYILAGFLSYGKEKYCEKYIENKKVGFLISFFVILALLAIISIYLKLI